MRQCKNGHVEGIFRFLEETNRHGKPYFRCLRCKADAATRKRREIGIGPTVVKPAIERFLAKVVKTDSCWLWNGFTTNEGYGRFDKQSVHRFSYQHYIGAIPEGLEIDHLCNVRNCVNPEHLKPVTQKENVRRAVERGSFKNHTLAGKAKSSKTHCPQGHEYAGDNLIIDSHSGARRCRICTVDKTLRYLEKVKNRR